MDITDVPLMQIFQTYASKRYQLRGVTIREKRLAIYCDIFSLYCIAIYCDTYVYSFPYIFNEIQLIFRYSF